VAVDRWQRRHAPAAFAVAVLKKFGDDRASGHAALLAYYAFLSMFPLLLVLVSVLGFVLEDDASLQEDVVDTALARIPVIGDQIADDVGSLTGSGIALAVGLAGALWAGLGVTLALGRAFDEIWDVPRVDQPGAVKARVCGLMLLCVLGGALIAASVGPGLTVGGGLEGAGWQLGAVAGALAANAIVFLAVFGLLTSGPLRVRQLFPGVTVAAAGSLLLQAVGGWYVDLTIVDASDTYGTFALVIGLLSWFWLGSHLLLIAAELNVVLHRRLWPRSLTGPLEPADRRALERAAAAARQDARQRIVVTFDDGSVDERFDDDHQGADPADGQRPQRRTSEVGAREPGREEPVDAEQPQA
jgi:membrane protein